MNVIPAKKLEIVGSRESIHVKSHGPDRLPTIVLIFEPNNRKSYEMPSIRLSVCPFICLTVSTFVQNFSPEPLVAIFWVFLQYVRISIN